MTKIFSNHYAERPSDGQLGGSRGGCCSLVGRGDQEVRTEDESSPGSGVKVTGHLVSPISSFPRP